MASAKVIKRKAIDTSALVAFILSILIILVAGVFVYFSIKSNDKKQQKIDQLSKDISDKLIEFEDSENKCLKLSRLVGWRIENEWGKSQGAWTNPVVLKQMLGGWSNIFKEKYQIDKYSFRDGAEDSQKEQLTIKSLLEELKKIIDKRKVGIQISINQRAGLWSQEIDLLGEPEPEKKGGFLEMEEEKSQETGRLRTECIEEEVRIADTIQRGEEEIASLNMQIKQLSEEITRENKQQEAKLTKLEQEKDDYEVRLQNVQQRIGSVEEGLEQDGEIIVSDPQSGYVYISLGRKDAIFGGMEFEVFTVLRGGLRKDKGKVIIRKIYKIYSECSLVPNTTDPSDPIIVGDYVNSRIYSRDKAKKFAFVGKPIGRYSLFELKKKIEEFGGQVLDDVSTDIAYLIAGDGYEKDSAYEKAIYWGIVVLREKELYDLLGLTW